MKAHKIYALAVSQTEAPSRQTHGNINKKQILSADKTVYTTVFGRKHIKLNKTTYNVQHGNIDHRLKALAVFLYYFHDNTVIFHVVFPWKLKKNTSAAIQYKIRTEGVQSERRRYTTVQR